MICLGIESTAHTFGCGIIDDKGRIYANVTDAYKTEKGGIHPSEAKLHHENIKDNVVEEALNSANLKLENIDLVSFSQGPGLAPCLLVGMRKAKELSKKINIPLLVKDYFENNKREVIRRIYFKQLIAESRPMIQRMMDATMITAEDLKIVINARA